MSESKERWFSKNQLVDLLHYAAGLDPRSWRVYISGEVEHAYNKVEQEAQGLWEKEKRGREVFFPFTGLLAILDELIYRYDKWGRQDRYDRYGLTPDNIAGAEDMATKMYEDSIRE